MKEKKFYQKNWFVILTLIFAFPIGLFLMWRYTEWTNKTKWIITIIIAVIFLSSIFSENDKETQSIQQTDNQEPSTVKKEETDKQELDKQKHIEEEKSEKKKELKEEKNKEEADSIEEKEEFENKTVEDIAKLKLNNVTGIDEYDGELTIMFEPIFSSNDKRMLTILTHQISQFLLDIKDNSTDLNDYSSLVVMAQKDNAVLYSLRITNEQFHELPENDIDGQIQLQYNMEDYVDAVSMLPQYRQVDGF